MAKHTAPEVGKLSRAVPVAQYIAQEASGLMPNAFEVFLLT